MTGLASKMATQFVTQSCHLYHSLSPFSLSCVSRPLTRNFLFLLVFPYVVHSYFAVSNVDSFSCSFLWFMFTRATFLRRYLLVTVFPLRVLSPSNLIWIFFFNLLFSLNNRSPSSGGDDPGIKQIKLFVLFLEGEDQRRNSDVLPSLMGAMAELFSRPCPCYTTPYSYPSELKRWNF